MHNHIHTHTSTATQKRKGAVAARSRMRYPLRYLTQDCDPLTQVASKPTFQATMSKLTEPPHSLTRPLSRSLIHSFALNHPKTSKNVQKRSSESSAIFKMSQTPNNRIFFKEGPSDACFVRSFVRSFFRSLLSSASSLSSPSSSPSNLISPAYKWGNVRRGLGYPGKERLP